MSKRELENYQKIERSLLTNYRKTIYSRVLKACERYELIEENDKVMVCISGGKDSFLLAKCIQELARHGKIKFEAQYVVMNPGYNQTNLELIIKNAQILNVPINIFETSIFEIVEKDQGKSPCYLCARMRRGHLYNKAKELGCNKIALGHHQNDIIETTLLSMFYGSEVKTMIPKLHSDNYKGIDLIRPLCLVKERDIIAWVKHNNLSFINCACRFTENCSIINDGTSKRKEIKELIEMIKQTNPDIDDNIYKAMENVNLNCILGGRKDGEVFSFLNDFNKNK